MCRHGDKLEDLQERLKCETRDFGIKWPHWHTLIFEEQLKVDIRVFCPQDAKKMFLKQARTVYWKRWAAKDICEELKEEVWLEPIQVMLRRLTNEVWTDKHQHVTRKLVVDGGWVQKRFFDNVVGRTEKHGLYHCPSWRDVSNQIPEGLVK